jgi:hypothetical protein
MMLPCSEQKSNSNVQGSGVNIKRKRRRRVGFGALSELKGYVEQRQEMSDLTFIRGLLSH